MDYPPLEVRPVYSGESSFSQGKGHLLKSRALSLALVLGLAALLTACSGSAPSQPAATATPAAAPKAQATATPAAPTGDGTLQVSLNVLNPEQKQDQYAVFFTATGIVEKGEAQTRFLGPFTMDVDEELVLDIDKDLKKFLYLSNGLDEEMYLDLTVTRIEDTHIRNPLCDPIKLKFDEELTTTDAGSELTVDITDSALNDLYPEEVLLIKIVSPTGQGGGGYPTIKYGGMGGMQKGSAGPDFLVPFPVEDFKKKGIREATLVIEDFDNRAISDPVALTFDDNGRCEQGQLVIVKTY